jgi:glycosyltransferase involved in cell wall biosynthesis
MACHNQAQYVAEALSSLQAQTVEEWEAIVIDDGSTDESVAVVERFADDPRIRLIKTKHGGAAAARNAGLRDARGALIAFLDADDRWHPMKLARQLDQFRAQPTLGVNYTRRNLIDPAGNPCGGDDVRPFHRGIVLDGMFRENFVCFSSAMVRRRVIDQCGLFDESLSVAIDYEWWLRVSRSCVFDFIDEALVGYRTGHASLSRRAEERLLTALVVMSRFVRHLDQPPRLSNPARRRGFAETYRSLGLVVRQRSTLRAFGWFARSLAIRPHSLTTWRAIISTLVPAEIRRVRRRLAGQPDWEQVYETTLQRVSSSERAVARKAA